MKKDFSKLLPALFNDKDLCFTELMENFFAEFDGAYCCNSQGTTFVGFIQDHEVRIHCVANRLEVDFINGKPSEELLKKVEKFFSIDEENSPFVCNAWKGNTYIKLQYYYKSNV